MFPLFRLLKTFARSLNDPGDANPYAPTVTRWRVLPNDVDAFGHMNNSRYQSIMDLGRIDYLLRCGFFKGVWRKRWAVPVGGVQINYRWALKPLEAYELHTQLVYWDERWFYFRHDFIRDQDRSRPACTAYVKTLFRGRGGSVPTPEVIRQLAGRELQRPALTDELRQAMQMDAATAPAATLPMALAAGPTAEREPLAIVGIGCRLPGGIRDVQGFWQFLMNGGDAIVDIPASRWDPKRYHDPSGRSPGRSDVQRAGLLQQDLQGFDAAFFGITPREAELMDPQQRLLLETSWEALEDAGIVPASLAGSRTAVYTGGFMLDNLLLRTRDSQRNELGSLSGIAGTMTMLASRLSYFYDLRGPSLSIDTACSSSLVACHHACESLWRGESDMALVAGANALLLPEMQVTMSKGHFLSPKGHCHAFGADADGYVRGEGAAVMVLRPLSAAQRDGQRVYAVIRGSACNQDGKTSGITVPNGAAQVAVMREAYARAGVSPRDVAYVEAHGTGTPVGDPIEAAAIGEVIGAGRAGDERCVMASVKTNLGHLEAAAGITGLIKAALCLQHGVAPPHLHAKQVNPKIDLAALGLQLPQQATPLPRRGGPLLAGVNSFGYGGTNAHVVLAEAPPMPVAPAAAPTRQALLLPISARSRDALAALSSAWAEALAREPAQADALLRTAATQRAHHRHRAVLVGADVDALVAAAREQRYVAQGEGDSAPALAFVYSGMGPQWWAMGRELMAREPVYAQSVQRSDAVFRQLAGWSIADELMRDEAHSRMTRTEVAQPANTVLQIALTELWASWGIRPGAVIGHSIGEVAAAHAAGVLSLEDALRVAYHRSRLQQRLAGRGGMLAAALGLDEAQACVQRHGPDLAVAAVNGSQSVTLAGPVPLLQQVAAELQAQGRFQRLLQVEVPYHSPLMDEVRSELQAALAGLQPRAPRVPVYASVSGQRLAAPWHDGAYWWANVRQTVLFAPAMHSAIDDGWRCFLEVGPHPVLASSIRDALRERGVDGSVLASLTHKDADELALARSLGALYTRGVAVDWPAWCGPGPTAAGPSYPWQRKPHWAERESSRRERVGAFPNHPLLSTHQPGPMAGWTAELNLGRTPALLDHVVAGVPLFPAAGFIELALAAHAQARGQAAASIENLDLVAALPLDPAQATHLTVQHLADGSAFRISAQLGDDEPSLCAKGHWFAAVDSDEQQDVAALAATLPHELSAPALYARLARMGLTYGPAYRGVQRLRHDEHELLAWLAVDEASNDGYAIAPPLLDAALHSLLALGGERYLGCELLPTGIRSFTFHRNPGARAVVHGRMDLSGSEPRCDLTLMDEQGHVCARLRGLQFQVLTRAEEGLSALAFERHHRPLPLAEADDAAPLIVFGGGDLGPAGNGAWQRVLSLPGLQAALAECARPPRVLDLRFITGDTGPQAAEQGVAAAHDFLATLQALPAQAVGRYIVVTSHAECISADDAAPHLAGAFVVGMARTAMTERPDLRLTLVDVDQLPAEPERWTARLGDEQEWALRRGQWHAVRVQRAEPVAPPQTRVPVDRQRMACTLQLGKAGRLDSLDFVPCERALPGPGEVRIAVEVAPLGYKDVMKALGILSSRALADTFFGDGLGMECAGRVEAVGEGVTGFAPGDRVYAAAPGTLRSHVVVNTATVARLPDDVSFVDGANLVAFGTVYHGLVHIARLAAGETVLIHGATGGVGLAAIEVARWRGARVIATAGSAAKRDHLRSLGIEHVSHSRDTRFHDDVMRWTDGRGVDVVLNFTPGDVMLKGVSCLARFGRFIEIGKVAFDQDTALPLRAFTENLSFSAIDFDRMTRFKVDEVRAIAVAALQHLSAGDFKPLPAQVFPASQVADAFRTMARGEHIGKVVVDLTDPALTMRAAAPPAIDPQRTQLITGGLGGFGLEVARALVARGARHLALLSRRGASSPEAQAALQGWQRQGLDVRAFAVDVADRTQLAHTLQQLRAQMPPLQGVLHAAAVLDDRPLPALDAQALDTAFGAKALGAWHLHALTLGDRLGFFVLFSSISAVVGNAHQANYAGANAFLDQLAVFRRSLGLPAHSLQWGVLGDSGMVARNAALGRLLAQQGLTPMSNPRALAALNAVLDQGLASPANLIVADVDWATMARRAPPWTGAARLADWRQATPAGAATGAARHWAANSPDELLPQIEAELVHIAAAIMKIAPADLSPAQPLREMGMDSLMALEIVVEIEARIGLKLPTLVLANGPSLRELALRVAGEISAKADVVADEQMGATGVMAAQAA